MSRRPTIFLSAAEASGDRHGAGLVRALRRRLPEARILGTAGPLMAAAGCEVVADLTAHASMVGGPFLRLGYWFRTVRRLQAAVRDVRPDVLVPIDSPALNWHLCQAARSVGSSVLYYIAPQVWAWAPWRIHKVRRLTDAVACILPFEEAYFQQRGVNARFVGHPLFDMERGAGVSPALCVPLAGSTENVKPSSPDAGRMPAGRAGETPAPRPDLLHAWSEGTWRIAVVPGSRRGEVAGHMMPLLTVVKSLAKRWPRAQFTLAAHNDDIAEIIRNACRDAGVSPALGVEGDCASSGDKAKGAPNAGGTPASHETPAPRIQLAVAQTNRVLADSHFGLIKSGTVTLEAAAAGLPMIIFYKTGPIPALLHRTIGQWRWAMPTPFLSLVNILAGRELVTELMPWRGNPARLEAAALDALDDLGHLHELREDLLHLVHSLQPHDEKTAADRTADMVVELLTKRATSDK